MARLSTAVHVQHPATREWILLEPGDEPAPEVAAQITNPDAWEDGSLAASQGEPVQEAVETPFGFTGTPEPVSEPEPEPESEAPAPASRRRRKTAVVGDSDA
ncbi:hypothetical protein [Streptomyces sp. NPDC001828]|uniref:hypothetical protein n=1 Tax=Streptomyces sp. NPDC001828 TaxID=3364615 RepID=UPI00369026AC